MSPHGAYLLCYSFLALSVYILLFGTPSFLPPYLAFSTAKAGATLAHSEEQEYERDSDLF